MKPTVLVKADTVPPAPPLVDNRLIAIFKPNVEVATRLTFVDANLVPDAVDPVVPTQRVNRVVRPIVPTHTAVIRPELEATGNLP